MGIERDALQAGEEKEGPDVGRGGGHKRSK